MTDNKRFAILFPKRKKKKTKKEQSLPKQAGNKTIV